MQSREPVYLFDYNWSAAIWQHPSEQDEEIKIRVTVTLKQSSERQAWIGKIWRNYSSSFKYIPFWRYVGTSAFLALLATLMIPQQVTMIPGFIIMKWFGWYNTLQPLWVFSFCGNAFYIFLLRQFMKGIPAESLSLSNFHVHRHYFTQSLRVRREGTKLVLNK